MVVNVNEWALLWTCHGENIKLAGQYGREVYASGCVCVCERERERESNYSN